MAKTDYNKLFHRTLSQLQGKPKLLLHVCCAPCLSGVLARVEKHFAVTLYYYNPNIVPQKEYEKRFDEIEKYLTASGRTINIIKAEYQPSLFASNPSEDSALCATCCGKRVEKTAEYAAQNGYDYFCTTLTVSPHKNAEEINISMQNAGERLGVKYLPSDFKKESGFLQSVEECKKYGIYRQRYCGCTPSKTIVAVTGGIASGKSEFVRILKGLGAYTISADDVSRRLMAEGQPLNEQVKSHFPQAVTDGTLDRAKLKAIIFQDEDSRRALDELTHKAIAAQINAEVAAAAENVVVVEVPLLFESGLDSLADVTVTLSAGVDERRLRAASRDRMSGEMFDGIIAAQMSDEEREARADIVVRNDGGIDALTRQAKELFDRWQ